ncbi:gamma-glutamyl-gamma-aminobutyrate hydrolase family protein [Porphyromonas gulae]|uniref:gamma-glutamyl-gamma-aminobutyrate hydrolase family protein n=1 Tax=Porphyromonas gulae TaxID=111105 RepID=UPI00052BC801|nr:gamma-glutamyl-gamma-aminobutyrate hydrolase family protein [Porphyromonas gulae]KGN88560.1 glutamine amidotransferase [Porphyromonas gulae]
MLSPKNYQYYPAALRQLYEELDGAPQAFEGGESPSRPVIGLTANYNASGSCIARAYTESVIRAGGLPLLIPLTADMRTIRHYATLIDGLILSGGDDLLPSYLGEDPIPTLGEVNPERDRSELLLVAEASRRNVPILGICRGHQLLATAFGGGMYQDIYARLENPLGHNPKIPISSAAHQVRLQGDSLLARVLGLSDGKSIQVNSLHHQAVSRAPKPFRVTALSSDGIIEAMEAYPEKPILSVQWHPEQMAYAGGDTRQQKLFDHLVAEASLFARAKAVHRSVIVLDSHVDTPMHFTPDFDFMKRGNTLVDGPKMCEGLVDACVMVAYLPQGERDDASLKQATDYATEKLEAIRSQVLLHPESLMLATNPEEVREAKRRGLRAIIPGIENGYAIGKELANIERFRDMGVCYITLCHNGDNDICDSARKSKHEHNGLSDFGREVVREMNRLGIMVDVSHTAPTTVRDVLQISTAPIVASHSSARALCDHARNLTDEEALAIARNGGVVQVCLYAGFIFEQQEEASVRHAADHIDHLVRLLGIEHVGIGSDFDGDGELVGCRGANDLINLTVELLRRDYTSDQLKLLWGENFLRVMHDVQERSKCH